MKKFISILLTTSMLAGSAAMPFAAIAAETVTTASRASEAAKTGTLTVTVYNEDEGGLYTDEHTCFAISGGPDQHADPGMSGAVLLCEVKPSESNPFVMNDIYISDNFKYTIVDSGSPEYDGFHYSIDRERSDRTFRFTENPNQNLSIYMEKHYFVVNSNTNVTASTHGQDVADNMGSVMSRATELINSNDFKALDIADRISKAKELMKSLYDEELIADYAFDAENNVMNFTYKHGTITGQLRPAVFEDEHKQLDQKGTKPMALDDVKELAKKGGELTWSDFEAYSGRKCGTPFDMLAYIYEIDESYYLFVSGAVDGAPDKVQLCHYNEHISVDVLTGDVEAFIAEYSNYELPDIGYTFDEIYNMTEDEVRNVFNEKGLTATEKYHVYPQRNGNTAVDNDSMTILLYPENYMINLTGHELVSHVTDMNDRDKLFKDSDIVWDSEKVRKSLGLPEEYFNIYVESSMGVIKSAPEGEDPDIRKYCKCSIRCTSKDKDKIADLRRAALNYIQLNPDFALVYHETSGGENVLTPEKNLKGDANCDGQVDLSDAVMIMQALANPNKYGIGGTAENHLTEQGKLNGDVNGDGLTVGDALAIQRKLLGLDNDENDSDIVVFEMSPSDAGVAEFLANNPTIKSSYKDDELFNITPQEITDKYGFKIFKYSGNCETYLEYKGKTYQLGSGWGGPGTVSFAVADLNNDGYYELYFTYSWGSGLNHAVLDCIDITSSIKFEGFDQLDYSLTDDFALAVENGKLGVYKAKYTSSGFVDIKAEPTVKLGEIIADNEKNKVVFVPVNSSDTDNDVTPSEPTTIGFSSYEEYTKYIEENDLANKIVTYDQLTQYGQFVQFSINSHWMYDNTFSLFYVFDDGSGKTYDFIINDRPQQLEDLVAYPKLTDDLINKSDMRTANTDADAYYEFDNKYYIYTNGKLSQIKWFDDKHIYILIGNPMLYDYPKVDNTYMSKLLDISSTTSTDNSVIAGKIFAYEKEGAGGYCTLSFNENGRFLYSPGKLSSYMGGGDWKIDGDTVSLIGMVDKTIYLKITDDTLVYIAESSDEFPYMDIKDGEKFAIYRPEISSDKFQLNSRYSEYGLGNPKVELNLIASELPEFCYVENVRLYDEDDNFIGMMSPAMDADIWSYLVDCNITEECSKTYYTLTKIRCGQKTYLDDVRSEITVNFKVTPAP